jgi:hypothetical protein
MRSALSVPQGCWLIGTEFSVGTTELKRGAPARFAAPIVSLPPYQFAKDRFLGKRKLQEALALHLVDGFSWIHNLVISSSDRPLVSGISQPTRKSVSKAPELKTQKEPSEPKCFCIIGNNWLPR